MYMYRVLNVYRVRMYVYPSRIDETSNSSGLDRLGASRGQEDKGHSNSTVCLTVHVLVRLY